MDINWFTFCAQIVNFLVLVALLKRFLYGPIVNAMRQREEEIAKRFEEADRKLRDAEEEAASYHKKDEDLERERDALVEEAKREAEEARKQLLDEARDEVQRKHDAWRESLDRQQQTLLENIQRRAAEEVVAGCRTALRELAGVDLEQRIAEEFLNRLERLEKDGRREITEAFRGRQQPAVVRTAFDASQDWQQRIREALRRHLSVDGEVAFETSPDVLCGVELQAAGHKIGWSADEFLGSLEEQLREAFSSRK
jgi:F-type H+-transporting ATPase subunit b